MASKRQIRFLASKIERLEEERQTLHRAVDEFVDKAVIDGKSWIENQEATAQSYDVVCATIDRTTRFVVQKCGEVEGESAESEDDDIDEVETSQSETKPSSSTTAKSSTPSASVTAPSATKSTSVLVDHLLLKLQERVEVIEGKVDEIQEIKTGMEEMKKKIKKSEEANEKTLANIQGKVDASEKEYSTNRSIDGQWLQKLEDKIGGLDQDMHSLGVHVKAVTEKVDQSDKRLSKVEKRIENAEDRIYDVEMEQEEHGNRIKTVEKRVADCEKKLEKVESLEENIRRIENERKGKDNERMNKVEERLSKIEEEKLPVLENRLSEVEEDRKKDLEEIGNIKSEVSSLSSRVVETKQQEQARKIQPAFTAQISGAPTLTEDTIVTDFSDVIVNRGDHFSASTGVFIAPVDGLYMASLCVRQHGDGHRTLRIYHERVSPCHAGSGQRVGVCAADTCGSGASCSSTGLVVMGKGDQLYVWVDGVSGSGHICRPSNFSCVLIG